MSRLTGLLLALVSGAVSWFVYAWASAKFGSPDPTWVASALLLSISFHEFSHWLAMERAGLKSHVIILVIVGGAFPDPSLSKRYLDLPWATRATITMAGVMGNMVLMAGAVLLSAFGLISDQHLGQFIQLNAGLVLYNLLPIGILDGGRFAKLLFDSLPEARDAFYARLITATALLGSLACMFFFRNYPMFTLLLFVYGSTRASLDDDPNGSYDRHAMDMATCRRWTAAYIGLIVVSMVLTYGTAGYRLFK